MKKLILVLLSVALLVGAGLITLAVIYRYDNIKDQQQLQGEREEALLNAKIADARVPLEDEIASLKAGYNTLHAECLKGKASYDLLTLTNQRKVGEPACGSAK